MVFPAHLERWEGGVFILFDWVFFALVKGVFAASENQILVSDGVDWVIHTIMEHGRLRDEMDLLFIWGLLYFVQSVLKTATWKKETVVGSLNVSEPQTCTLFEPLYVKIPYLGGLPVDACHLVLLVFENAALGRRRHILVGEFDVSVDFAVDFGEFFCFFTQLRLYWLKLLFAMFHERWKQVFDIL